MAVPVDAPALEAELMRAPRLAPLYLAHGAEPAPEPLVPWLLAEASPVDRLLAPGSLAVGGLDVLVHDVSGHADRQAADATAAALGRVRQAVLDAVAASAPDPTDAVEVLARTAATLGVADPDLARWRLHHTAIQAHLGALRAAGRLTPVLRGHRLPWRAT